MRNCTCIIKLRKEIKELTITIENNKEKKGRGFSLLNLNQGKRSGGDK
jgi:ribosomal protein L13E